MALSEQVKARLNEHIKYISGLKVEVEPHSELTEDGNKLFICDPELMSAVQEFFKFTINSCITAEDFDEVIPYYSEYLKANKSTKIVALHDKGCLVAFVKAHKNALGISDPEEYMKHADDLLKA